MEHARTPNSVTLVHTLALAGSALPSYGSSLCPPVAGRPRARRKEAATRIAADLACSLRKSVTVVC